MRKSRRRRTKEDSSIKEARRRDLSRSIGKDVNPRREKKEAGRSSSTVKTKVERAEAVEEEVIKEERKRLSVNKARRNRPLLLRYPRYDMRQLRSRRPVSGMLCD